MLYTKRAAGAPLRARRGRDRNGGVSLPIRFRAAVALGCVAAATTFAACVPPGNSTPSDAGPSGTTPAAAVPTPTFKASENIMKTPFFDNFDRAAPSGSGTGTAAKPPMATASAAPSASAPPAASGARAPSAPSSASTAPSASAVASATAPSATAVATVASAMPSAAAPGSDLGPDWTQAGTSAWHIENGRLCGQGAKNHGVWLNRVLPVNARIEFDAISDSPDGDLKAEVWGDGRSAATSVSYTNATSYLVIFGGWSNKFHVLARINEHGNDRKEIKVDTTSDDPKQRPVMAGQIYHFKIERTDGKTVRWFVDDVELHSFADAQPLVGAGHDHFGFNNWNVKVCFDNVRVTPL